MKTYNTQAEVEADIKDGVLYINDSVKFKCSVNIDARIEVSGDINAWNISARNISAWDINAWNINAWNISARNISAGDINSWNINARNISARNINAWNISARNISAWDINAWNINARDIIFHAVAFAYVSFKCKSIRGTRNNAKYFCLDSKMQIEEFAEALS